jgi:hypothetical protein
MPDLANLDVEWVSLVDRAAVRDPVEQSEPMRFLIWKRDTQHPSQGGHMSKLTKELLDQLGKAVDNEADLAKLVEKAEHSEDVAKALQGAARLIAAHKDELSPEIMAELTKFVGLEPEAPEPTPEPKTAAELVASLKKSDIAEEVISEVESALAKAAEKAEIDKADLPPAVKAALEKAESDRAEDRKRAEKAEKIAKEERNTRLTKEFVAKAEDYKALAVKAEDFGPVLKEASEKLSEEAFEALEKALNAADEGLAKSELFKEQGANGVPEPGDAFQEATRKAAELRKSDSKLSEPEALDKVLRSDRDLQERYLAEVR